MHTKKKNQVHRNTRHDCSNGLRPYAEKKEVKALIDDWADYYNNDRYQWDLARLSPNEYAQYIKTGVYSLQIPKTKGTDDG